MESVSKHQGVRLAGKVVLVTGAGNGIGNAVAHVAAAEGGLLALLDYNGDAAATAAAAIGGDAIPIRVDVGKLDEIDAGVAKVIAHFGKIDVLVNAAGVMDLCAPMEEVTAEMWDRIFDINVRGTAFMMQGALKHMLPAKSGAIVNVASTSGIKAGGGGTAYAASKGAVISLTRQAAYEVASRGVRVNAIAPGATQTNFLESSTRMFTAAGPMAKQFLDKGTEEYGRSIALGRYATPIEIARAAVFLASNDSSYMTGTTMVVDGGATI